MTDKEYLAQFTEREKKIWEFWHLIGRAYEETLGIELVHTYVAKDFFMARLMIDRVTGEILSSLPLKPFNLEFIIDKIAKVLDDYFFKMTEREKEIFHKKHSYKDCKEVIAQIIRNLDNQN